MRTIVLCVRTVSLICLLFISAPKAKAQAINYGTSKFELGLSIGPMFFLGDLGGGVGEGTTFVKDLNWGTVNLSGGVHANFYPTEWLGFRLALNYGKVEGYDSLTNSAGGAEEFRKRRNLQFRSTIWEAYAAMEIYPTVFLEQYDGLQGKLRPYGVVGIGAFKFNPQGQYYVNGTMQWVDLQPLHTEGQGMDEYPNRKPYSLVSLEVPLGIGVKYYIKENMYVGLELLHRKSFTDYIDDVSTTYIDNSLFSKYLTPTNAAMANQLYFRENFNRSTSRVAADGEQRGNPNNNDSFFSTLIRFGWRMNGMDGATRQMRCPAFY